VRIVDAIQLYDLCKPGRDKLGTNCIQGFINLIVESHLHHISIVEQTAQIRQDDFLKYFVKVKSP